MRISETGTKLTNRNQPIRMCIGNALIHLMETKPLEQIKITEIAAAAHISRMTFYKYYESKAEVLEDYLYEIVNAYIEEVRNTPEIGGFRDYTHICHCFQFFQQHSSFVLTLIRTGMYSILINALNHYMDTYVLPYTTHYTRYELYYYSGALCNTFVKWIEAGMQETPEEIATLVYQNTKKLD